MSDAISQARAEMLPLLRSLCDLVEAEGDRDQHGFFSGILQGIESASDPEDLADPFMALSTSAFLGFDYGPLTALLLDQVLIAAQRLTMTLSASDEVVH
jgi:hypothetical protein